MDSSRIRVVKTFCWRRWARTETLNFEIIACLWQKRAGGKVKMKPSPGRAFLTHKGRPETDVNIKIGD